MSVLGMLARGQKTWKAFLKIQAKSKSEKGKKTIKQTYKTNKQKQLQNDKNKNKKRQKKRQDAGFPNPVTGGSHLQNHWGVAPSKLNLAFYPYKIDQISTRNFWEHSRKK